MGAGEPWLAWESAALQADSPLHVGLSALLKQIVPFVC